MPNEDELAAIARDFTVGDDAMRTYRQIYVAQKFSEQGRSAGDGHQFNGSGRPAASKPR